MEGRLNSTLPSRPVRVTCSTAIMVTEFHNTTQAIGELYSQYVDRNAGNTEDLATQPAPMKLDDLDLSNERTTVLVPNTKTEIAVDIDLDEPDVRVVEVLRKHGGNVARAAQASMSMSCVAA